MPQGENGPATLPTQIVSAARGIPRSPLIGSMLDAQKRERDRIVVKFAQVRGLMPLLMKRRNGMRRGRDERLALHDQMQALAHLSPYLMVLALPGSFMFIPALARWLDRRRLQRGPRPGAPH